MNSRAFLKNIVLFILLTISIFFIFINSNIGLTGIGSRPLFIPITLALNILLLEKRKEKKKPIKIIFSILCFLNISWFLYHTYELIIHYIKWNYLELDITYLYLIILLTTFFTSLPDLKKQTNSLNDILTILTTILMILIHYRYYLDKNFLHNIVKNVPSNQYNYITQYYIIIILMYTILFINKKINQIKK